MDRITIEQLNRMEQKLDDIQRVQEEVINIEVSAIITQFYEEEVTNPQGQLHYLKDDQVLKTFVEKLTKEDEEETTTEEEYRNEEF